MEISFLQTRFALLGKNRIELAGSEVSLISCETSSDRHSDDVEGFATGSSGFLGSASRLLSLNRPVWQVLISSSIVAWGN